MTLLEYCFYVAGILFFVYAGLVVRSLRRKGFKILETGLDAAIACGDAGSTVKSEITRYRGIVDPMLKRAAEHLEIPPAAHLVDAGINFMAHIGAQDLGKNGLGLDKDQIGRIVMARNGFNTVGKKIGDGIGVPQLLERADRFSGMVPGGAPGAPGAPTQGMPLGQMLMSFLGGQFGIPGVAPQAPVKPKDLGGLPPL